VFSGVLRYFPDALLEVAHCSWVGNEQHNPGQSLHWAKEKSTDEPDALVRHLMSAGTLDTDGVRHSAKVAWRALALLQREIEAEQAASQPDPAYTGGYQQSVYGGPCSSCGLVSGHTDYCASRSYPYWPLYGGY
jgi:hypothetical protein